MHAYVCCLIIFDFVIILFKANALVCQVSRVVSFLTENRTMQIHSSKQTPQTIQDNIIVHAVYMYMYYMAKHNGP